MRKKKSSVFIYSACRMIIELDEAKGSGCACYDDKNI